MTQQQASLDAEIEQLNSDNEWLAHIEGGKAKTPYLKSIGKLKKKPGVITVSSAQRKVIHG